MNIISFNDLINVIQLYNSNHEDIELIKKAYQYASFYHDGQKRESGEDYIIHPLNVCYILAEMHADTDTLCAALLHDTLEDTKLTKEEIEHEFNSDIASLVDGVTNIKDLTFKTSSQELKAANTRKIITGVTKDVRIIIIKLADRLHNMRTLAYKNHAKQLEKAEETMKLYVPFSYYIGAYKLKAELEDLSFKYLEPEQFKIISEQRLVSQERYGPIIDEMSLTLERILLNQSIPYAIRKRVKNIYGIYKKAKEGKNIDDIPDLIALKVIVDSIDNCYKTLGLIHHEYLPVNDRFRDFICNPKTNMYQSLHSTVCASDRLVEAQIRTFDMDKVAEYGLTALWNIRKDVTRGEMQEELRKRTQFFSTIADLDVLIPNNRQFVDSVVKDIQSEKIYVQTTKGTNVELPKGSTIIDFIYRASPLDARRLISAYVNDVQVPFNHVLQNQDRVKIFLGRIDQKVDPNWELYANTDYARRLIREDKNN